MKRCGLLSLFAVISVLAKCAESNELEAVREAETITCPVGYKLSNGLCYLNTANQMAENCNTEANTETTPNNNAEITTNSPLQIAPAPDVQIKCPHGSILFNGQCRRIICPAGEFIAGRCLKIACPTGMVWRGNSCQAPEYLTTILEIENVFRSEVHESHGNLTSDNVNKINNLTATTWVPPTTTETTTLTPPKTSPKTTRTTTTTTTTTQRPPAPIVRLECCTVRSPRLCKNYERKWVCFNHRREFCDRNLCAFPTIYLKTPQIVYKDNLLVMPPRPPLKACRERGCDVTETVDCSGCIKEEKQNCSPYCYHYYCPENTCGYMDLHEFCKLYPKHPFGCNQDEGCIWGYCGGKRT